jgi:hypothetical protein
MWNGGKNAPSNVVKGGALLSHDSELLKRRSRVRDSHQTRHAFWRTIGAFAAQW